MVDDMDGTRTVEIVYDGTSALARNVVAGVIQFARERAGWVCRLADRSEASGESRSPPLARLTCLAGGGATDPSLPLVRLSTGRSRGDDAEISIDRVAVMRLAVEHLVACGIESVAFAAPRPLADAVAWASAYSANRRPACASRLYKPPPQELRENGLHPLAAWISALPVPTGIVAPSDADALLLIDACRHAGRNVPTDVAIVGIGNDELACEAGRPTVSSIDLGLFRLGQEAARLLERLLDDAHAAATPKTVAVPPLRVVSRESTDTLAVGDPRVAAALQELRGRLADPPTPEKLAGLVGLSRASLERRLKVAIGRSIHGELLRLRVTEAHRLLVASDMPIREVAATTGFGSVQYMTTVIRRQCGMTPAHLRDAAGRRPTLAEASSEFPFSCDDRRTGE